jgi:hypothetical protein
MEKKILICFLALIISLTGCTLGMVGKHIPRHNLRKLSSSDQTAYWPSGDSVTFRIEDTKLVGSINIKKRGGSAEFHELILTAYVADKNLIIRAKSSCSWTKSDEIATGESADFVINMPEDHDNLEYVGFGWREMYDG